MERALILAMVACGSAAAPPDAMTWATYTIRAGDHDAYLDGRTPKNPIDGVTDATGRDYELVLDPSASYELVNPTEPNDQLDWNKLPGVSDCGEIDLSIDGVMFGWRWRPELQLLELAAYANDAHVHIASDVLVVLDADDLAAREPLHYRLWREVDHYELAIAGTMRGRAISATAQLPRACADQPLDVLAWAASFYFGGTSVAPHDITAQIHESRFE